MALFDNPLVGPFKRYTQCSECKAVFEQDRTRYCCSDCGSTSLKAVIAREICKKKHIGFLTWRNLHSHYEVK